jgi:hypothetical protein
VASGRVGRKIDGSAVRRPAGNSPQGNEAMRIGRNRPAWILHLLALCAFALAALWNSRAVLEHPATVVTYDPAAGFPRKFESRAREGAELMSSDLKRGVAQLSYAARTLSTDPLEFFDGWMCFPIGGVPLGEHMLGDGIVGIPAQILWSDPVATYNFVVTLKPWLAAAGMYALTYYWTASWAAALLAGFLFGFHPMRLADAAHPSVVGNEWIPAILLCLDLLFTRRRWRDAILLAVIAPIQLLSSMYVLIQCALVVGVYGVHLAWRHRDAILVLLPKLALVAGSLVLVGTWALGPYLEIRELWNIRERPAGFRGPPAFFWFGRQYFPGIGLILLASLGLLDRLFAGPRDRDPRLPLTAALLATVWFLFPWRVPFTPLTVPNLGEVMHTYVPGVAAVRAPDKVFFGVTVPLAVLAAFALRALGARLAAAPRAIVLTLLGAACVAEVFVPSAAARSFGAALPSMAFRLRPPERDLDAVRDLPDGAVLDLPGNYHFLWLGKLSRYVLLGAYHGHRISSCKASFRTPVQFEVNKIALRLPAADAARELWALGFRTVIFHAQDVDPFRQQADRVLAALADPAAGPHLIPLGEGETIRVARLVADGPVTTDIGSLSPSPRPRLARTAGAVGLPFGLRGGEVTFRHPEPIEPTDLFVTWKQGGTVVHSETVRGLLPLALAAGRSDDIRIGASVPERPGHYEVTLALADDPNLILARERIRVQRERAADAPSDGRSRASGSRIETRGLSIAPGNREPGAVNDWRKRGRAKRR